MPYSPWPIPAMPIMRKFGANFDVDDVEDIIVAGGFQTWPTSAYAGADIDIISTDAKDTLLGVGARTLTIEGLDANGRFQSETIALNGNVGDVHPTKDYLRIFQAWVASAGAEGDNAGTITIDVDGSNILAMIAIGYGQTLQATYTIPADYRHGWLTSYDANAQGNAAGLFGTLALQTRQVGSGSWITKELFQVDSSTAYYRDLATAGAVIKLPAMTDIRMRVLSTSAANATYVGGFCIQMEA